MEPLPIDVDPQSCVWRYLSLWRLFNAIETKRLSLTLLRKYLTDDPYETSVPESVDQADAQISNSGQTTMAAACQIAGRPCSTTLPDHQQRYKDLKRKRRALLRTAHASCWRLGNESEAMWRLYCPGAEGVAICTTFGKLKDSIHDPLTVVSRVAYIDYKTDQFVRHSQDGYDPALHKRKAFEHEDEVRVLRFSSDDFQRAGTEESYSAPEYVEIEWDPETVVEKIVVNPRCANGYLKLVTVAVKTLSPILAEKVQRSDLAAPPRW